MGSMMGSEQKKGKGWQRARTPDQQTQRRQEILEAAYGLFSRNDYEQVSLNAIAQEAGLSKSSVYLYFETREEIFMEIFFSIFRDWFDESVAAIAVLPERATTYDAIEAWMDVSWRNERLRAIAPLVAVSIEHNVPEECLEKCLRLKREQCVRLREALRRFVELDEGKVWELFLYAFSLFSQFIGFEKNGAIASVMKQPEFAAMARDYRLMTTRSLALFLQETNP